MNTFIEGPFRPRRRPRGGLFRAEVMHVVLAGGIALIAALVAL